MDKSITLFVVLEVHEDGVYIAVASASRDVDVRYWGTVGGDLGSINKALRRLISCGQPLHIVYKAESCGFEIWPHLTRPSLPCEMVALPADSACSRPIHQDRPA